MKVSALLAVLVLFVCSSTGATAAGEPAAAAALQGSADMKAAVAKVSDWVALAEGELKASDSKVKNLESKVRPLGDAPSSVSCIASLCLPFYHSPFSPLSLSLSATAASLRPGRLQSAVSQGGREGGIIAVDGPRATMVAMMDGR